MPIRNPFARRPGPAALQDDAQRPGSSAAVRSDAAHPGFERVDTVGSKASSAFSIRGSRKSQDTGEYKMSAVFTYQYPSPVEKEATWPRRYLARTSSDKSNSNINANEIEHFPISRESFDSYRRSFDISARSPITIPDTAPARQSLDSSRFAFRHHQQPRFPRSSLSDVQRRWGGAESSTLEDEEGGENFEEVGLTEDDGGKQQQQQQRRQAQQPQHKKRTFFKFGSDITGSSNGAAAATAPTEEAGGGTAMSRFLSPLSGGSKKVPGAAGQQQGAELGAMPERSLKGLQAQEVEG
ncbi:hypothetical protein N0V88_006660 [Collariella sp. IMI 366227]|nr:hypothetical protein N0V88_006660 [Collariella sp. IMI 366227]